MSYGQNKIQGCDPKACVIRLVLKSVGNRILDFTRDPLGIGDVMGSGVAKVM